MVFSWNFLKTLSHRDDVKIGNLSVTFFNISASVQNYKNKATMVQNRSERLPS